MLPKKFSLLLIFSIILTLGLSISLGSLLAAWTAPVSAPPQGNIAAPINTSTTGQAKQGGLIINTGGSANGLIIQFGNVGIGTTTPGAKLEVAGNIIADAPTASNQVATKGYVDAASGGVGGCYWDYSNACATGYVSVKTAAYGWCRLATGIYVHRPPGASCTGADGSGDLGTAALCCSAETKATGQTCIYNSDCSSNYCADGYCCNSACGSTCQACNISGSIGTCTPVPIGTDPANECAATTCSNYIYGGTNPSCYRYASATSHNGMCNGAGACYTSLADSCKDQGSATITCGNTACWKACVADSLATGYDNYNEVCYTSGTQGCTGGLVCDDVGACKKPDGTACTAGSECASGFCSASGICAKAYLVFTTSVTGPPKMSDWSQTDQSGLAGADEICNVLATNAGITGRTFKAWLSSESFDIRDRIPDVPYYLVDKTTKVCDSRADLLDGSLDHAINMTEMGTTISSYSYVWTGTDTQGVKIPTGEYDQCATAGVRWTNNGGVKAMVGRETVTASDWTQAGAMGCSGSARLYCFEVTQCGDGTVNGSEVCDDGATSWTTGNCGANCDRFNYWSWPISHPSMLGKGFESRFCFGQGFATYSSLNSTSFIVSSSYQGVTSKAIWHYVYGGVYPTGYGTFLWTTTQYMPFPTFSCTYGYTDYQTRATYPGQTSTYTKEEYDVITAIGNVNSCIGNAGYSMEVNSGVYQLWCAD